MHPLIATIIFTILITCGLILAVSTTAMFTLFLISICDTMPGTPLSNRQERKAAKLAHERSLQHKALENERIRLENERLIEENERRRIENKRRQLELMGRSGRLTAAEIEAAPTVGNEDGNLVFLHG